MYDKEWTYGQWPVGFIDLCKPSIEYVELYALTVAVAIWAHKLGNARVTIFCNNEAVVHMVNNGALSCSNCMYLLQKVAFLTLKHNFRLSRNTSGQKTITFQTV